MHAATGAAVPLPLSSMLTVTRSPREIEHFVQRRNAFAFTRVELRSASYDVAMTRAATVRGAFQRVVVYHHEPTVDAIDVEFDRVDTDFAVRV